MINDTPHATLWLSAFSCKMKLTEGVHILAIVVCFVGNCACISHGTDVTSLNGFKYQAAIFCPVNMCSGAIVSSKNVLTTATCVNGLSPADVQVYVGSVTLYANGFSFDVANILKHPNFNANSYDSNIAILTLQISIPFSTINVQPITLALAAPVTDSTVTTSAYGAIDVDFTLPDYLQKVKLQVYSRAVCQVLKQNRLTSSMFCAGDWQGKNDLCPGDQGAPMVYQNVLYGIYSWGCSCGLAFPDRASSPVFTLISFFRTWILSNIITP